MSLCCFIVLLLWLLASYAGSTDEHCCIVFPFITLTKLIILVVQMSLAGLFFPLLLIRLDYCYLVIYTCSLGELY